MRIRRTAVLAASFMALVPWAPAAQAAAPTIQATFTVSYNHSLSGGWLVVLGCKSVLTTATTQAPLATAVTCTVNDSANSTQSRALSAGPAISTQVTVLSPLGPIFICVTGKGTAMETETGDNRVYLVSHTPACVRLPST